MNILVTGGTGTFGYALCRENKRLELGHVFTILSRSELALSRMRLKFPEHRYVIGDVRDFNSMVAIASGHEGVIHAAAMKRIPECERQPEECYKTNVIGSANVLTAARWAAADWCLAISTDKACGAITTYGASKLLMEGLFAGDQATRYSTKPLLVRYGNIVASNGSVIPTWQDCYEKGKYLPITHEDMTRFWMSPTDAVRLVLFRIQVKDYPGILVPKMKALSVVDMVHDLFPGAQTVVSGLRSTEKLHEDLVLPNETCQDMGLFYYLLRGREGELGTSYSSETAPKLAPEEIRSMLDDARGLEELMK